MRAPNSPRTLPAAPSGPTAKPPDPVTKARCSCANEGVAQSMNTIDIRTGLMTGLLQALTSMFQTRK